MNGNSNPETVRNSVKTQEEIEQIRRVIRENEMSIENRRKSWAIIWFILAALTITVLIIWLVHFPKYVTEHLSSYERFYKQHLPAGDSGGIGEIGDLMGGTMGPLIAIAGAILTFLAFWVQFRANQIQKQQYRTTVTDQKWELEDQKRNWEKGLIESRFFELLKLHKENVNEMNIEGKIQGRRCFVAMYHELRWIFTVVDNEYKKLKATIPLFQNLEINTMNFAYEIFFNGFTQNAPKNAKDPKALLYLACTSRIVQLQTQWITRKKNHSPEEIAAAKAGNVNLIDPEHDIRTFDLTRPGEESGVDYQITVYYKPLEGHAEELGHYYRHLFQTCRYITTQDILSAGEKHQYMRTLRAQLSNFEQIMLYYNAIAWFEDKWKDWFINNRLIKNLPLELANFYSLPQERYRPEMIELWKKGIKLFENQGDPF